MRRVWGSDIVPAGVYARGDLGIKSAADLKGKRIGWPLGSPTNQNVIRGCLAFAGLTLDDVILVDFPGYTAAAKSVIEGLTDAANFTPMGALAYELAASRYGVTWIQFPPDDVEGWKRLHEIEPYAAPSLVKKGGGVTPENPIWTKGWRVELIAYDFADEWLSYNLAKALDETYDDWKDVSGLLKLWTVKGTADLAGGVIPFHPGLVKYLKEVGLWTDEHEKFQKEQLRIEEERIKAWKPPAK